MSANFDDLVEFLFKSDIDTSIKDKLKQVHAILNNVNEIPSSNQKKEAETPANLETVQPKEEKPKEAKSKEAKPKANPLQSNPSEPLAQVQQKSHVVKGPIKQITPKVTNQTNKKALVE